MRYEYDGLDMLVACEVDGNRWTAAYCRTTAGGQPVPREVAAMNDLTHKGGVLTPSSPMTPEMASVNVQLFALPSEIIEWAIDWAARFELTSVRVLLHVSVSAEQLHAQRRHALTHLR